MLARNITGAVQSALGDTPVVLVNGPRQSGKSTLVQSFAETTPGARYYTLDDAAVLAAAHADAAGFVAGIEGLAVLDEVQRAPELLIAIKAEVDRRRAPGRFLLTGSANILLVPRLSESLAGRMEILTLWPFSQGEIEGVAEGFVDALFSDRLPELAAHQHDAPDLMDRLFAGGFPEARARRAPARRRAWFSSYVTTILQRDVRDLANIEGLSDLPRLLSLLAARACGLLNVAELSRSTTIPKTTLSRYLTALQTVYLFEPATAWSGSPGRRLTRAPKIHLSDSGLIAHLLGLTGARLERDMTPIGPLLENFVAMEIRKQAGWSETAFEMMHFRAYSGEEVDVVLEDPAGRVVGIEVKASATIVPRDLKGLRAFKESVGDRFHRGVVLYTGTSVVPFGEDLHALPVSALWRMAARPH